MEEKKRKTVTIPLLPEDLKEFVLNKDTKKINREPDFIVNYKDSALKDKHFMSYISNMRLCVRIDEATLTEEDKFELMKLYMTSRTVAAINNLAEEAAALLMYRKGVDLNDEFFTNDQRNKFLEDNIEDITPWEEFYESFIHTTLFSQQYFAETVGKGLIDKGEVSILKAPVKMSINVLNLVYVPHFVENYLALVTDHRPTIYQYLLDEAVFEGATLRTILVETTTLLPFLYQIGKLGEESRAKKDECKPSPDVPV